MIIYMLREFCGTDKGERNLHRHTSDLLLPGQEMSAYTWLQRGGIIGVYYKSGLLFVALVVISIRYHNIVLTEDVGKQERERAVVGDERKRRKEREKKKRVSTLKLEQKAAL